MNNLLQKILSFKIRLIALLPFCLLYLISDFIYFFIRYVLRYRIKVVKDNLTKSFPEKNKKEINFIIKKFYRNISDIIVETIKYSNIKINKLSKRIQVEGLENIHKYLKKEKSIIACMGHRGNWEWAGTVFIHLNNAYAVYQPLKNVYFNNFLNSIRTRFKKNCLISSNKLAHYILKNKNTPTFYLILADQSPPKSKINYQINFLNQQTPFFTSIERIAKHFNFPVFFLDIIRIKRGHYKIIIEEICSNPSDSDTYYITNAYVRRLEKAICKQPDNWLWSHRRWKYANIQNKYD